MLTSGDGGEADVRVTDLELDRLGRPRFTLATAAATTAWQLRLAGAHQALNAAAAAAAAVAVGLPLAQVCAALNGVESPLEVADGAARAA